MKLSYMLPPMMLYPDLAVFGPVGNTGESEPFPAKKISNSSAKLEASYLTF